MTDTEAVEAAQRIVADLGDVLPHQFAGGEEDSLTVARAYLSASAARDGWRTMESAPTAGYIIGAWQDGSRWRCAQIFNENDEWVDAFSDRIHQPTHWCSLPTTGAQT